MTNRKHFTSMLGKQQYLVESQFVNKSGGRLYLKRLSMVETLNLLCFHLKKKNRQSGWEKAVNAKGNKLKKKSEPIY